MPPHPPALTCHGHSARGRPQSRSAERSSASPRALSRRGARTPSSIIARPSVISPADALEFCTPEAQNSNSHTNDWENFEFCTFSRVLHSSRSWEIGPL